MMRTVSSAGLGRNLIPAYLFALGAASLLTPAQAQGPRGPRYASLTATAQPASVARGGHGKLVIKIAVAPGFHLNSNKPDDPSLIATSFAPASVQGVHFGAAQYPKVSMVKTAAMPKPIPAYVGNVSIVVPFTVDKSVRRGPATVGGTLTYQGCNANACYPPKQDKIGASVMVK